FVNCRFYLNLAQAGGGGGLVTAGGTCVNCLFDGNQATGGSGGAGIYGSCALYGCTLIGNTSGSTEAAGLAAGSPSSCVNTIIWGNSNGASGIQSAQVSGPATINYCCVQGWTGSLGGAGNTGNDPHFLNRSGPDNVAGT